MNLGTLQISVRNVKVIPADSIGAEDSKTPKPVNDQELGTGRSRNNQDL